MQHVAPIYIDLLVPATSHPPVAPAHVHIHRITTPFDGISANLAKLWFEQIGVPRTAHKLGAQLLHVPYFAAPWQAHLPVLTTIPDLIPLTRPAYRGSLLVRAYMQLAKASARRSTALIAISQHVATQAQHLLDWRGGPIHVTHLAADPMYAPMPDAADILAQRGIDGPFIYYVGGYDERKQVRTLVAAFALLPEAVRTSTKLVLAGSPAGTDTTLFPDIWADIQRHGIATHVVQLPVSRADNPLFYAAATVFVYPSVEEGFGLPPLEAMACGTPVICCHTSSLPEVVGDAALCVPPHDAQALSDALQAVLTDPDLRTRMRADGIRRAQRFTYATTASQTLTAYMRLITTTPESSA
jgi:glycosyltransferase involved in cell wall biosynthesis